MCKKILTRLTMIMAITFVTFAYVSYTDKISNVWVSIPLVIIVALASYIGDI